MQIGFTSLQYQSMLEPAVMIWEINIMKHQIGRKISDCGVYKSDLEIILRGFLSGYKYYFCHLSVHNTCFNELRYRLFLNMYNMSVQG